MVGGLNANILLYWVPDRKYFQDILIGRLEEVFKNIIVAYNKKNLTRNKKYQYAVKYVRIQRPQRNTCVCYPLNLTFSPQNVLCTLNCPQVVEVQV